jgi:hypothetical protein
VKLCTLAAMIAPRILRIACAFRLKSRRMQSGSRTHRSERATAGRALDARSTFVEAVAQHRRGAEHGTFAPSPADPKVREEIVGRARLPRPRRAG